VLRDLVFEVQCAEVSARRFDQKTNTAIMQISIHDSGESPYIEALGNII